LIFSICNEEDSTIAWQFAVLLWTAWNNRNDKVWNGKNEVGRNMGFKALQYWQDWFALQQHDTSVQQQQHVTIWQKPPMGWSKCNVDAGFHHHINKTSARWCLRDHFGRFIRAGTTWREAKYSVGEGEALALLEAIKVLENERATQVIFETDSKYVLDAIYNSHSSSSEFSAIICNVKRILLSNRGRPGHIILVRLKIYEPMKKIISIIC
jgi:hypothetical protein